ncbi:hypothetical protein C8Q75DRAFT_781601 [Abortiporus biennis]|nr:hypothetical protein C8Q75DRAFT_781601 [Abortiporus biennis]
MVHSPSITAASESLAARKQVHLAESGLTSVEGARQAIQTISSRKLVTHLSLSHNWLGDDGCEELCRYLCSDEGRKYRISEISLRSNGIGDRGLAALTEYVRGNSSLRELFLQNNIFDGELDITTQFAEALNTSEIRELAFSANEGDGDALISNLLASLDAPFLRDLHFSETGLTYRCVASIVEYITSPRCQLHTLRLNANRLGKRGIKALLDAVEKGNFSLTRLDLYSNTVDNSDEAALEEDEGGMTSQDLQANSERLKKLTFRNDRLKRETEKQAFTLLRHARPVLLPSARPQSRIVLGFSQLPIEVQLHILSCLAPSLSSTQRIKIFHYASSPATLPRLLPTLPSAGCIPDPSSFTFGPGVSSPGSPFGFGPGSVAKFSPVTTSGGCSNGRCMGAGNSVVCRREAERMRWLGLVGCTAYEPEGLGSTILI